MKRIVFLIAVLLTSPMVAWSGQNTVNGAVEAFYGALKAGDVEVLQQMIEDPLYSQVKVLLTQNTEYPDFLRSHYSGSSGVVLSSNLASPNDASVDFEISYQDGSVALLRLRLRGDADGSWKVVEQEQVK